MVPLNPTWDTLFNCAPCVRIGPQLMLLDEPTSALDPVVEIKIVNAIHQR